MDQNTLDKFSITVGSIYEAGLNPDSWPVALEMLAEELDTSKIGIIYINPEDLKFSFSCGYGFDPYLHNIGLSRFRRFLSGDPITQYGSSHLDEVFSDSRILTKDELHASSMHQEVRRPAGMEHLLTVVLTDESPDWTCVFLLRGPEEQPYTREDEMALARYAPHIRRSAFIHKSLASPTHLKTIQSAVLDRLDANIIVVDSAHEVVMCNQQVRQIMSQSNNIRISNGRLICNRPGDNRLLQDSISSALLHSDEPNIRRMAVRIHGDGDNYLMAVTTPLQIQRFEEKFQKTTASKPHYTATVPSRKHAIITLCDPSTHYEKPVEMLEELFGLTRAEAMLVNCLSQDYSLNEAADILARSVGTARVQLKSIFEKTDTNRQSSLIRLIMAIR